MRAVVLNRFGPPSELVGAVLPDPAPGPGQVVVAVEAASITFVETQIRAGHPPHSSMSPALPVILGNGVGGVVAAVGPDADARPDRPSRRDDDRRVGRLRGTGRGMGCRPDRRAS